MTLARVRPFVIEPLKTFILRQSRYQWVVIGTFSRLNLAHYGRFAIDGALLERFEIPGHTREQLIRVRGSTPDHDGIKKHELDHGEICNAFFLAMWAEFEAAVDDIRYSVLIDCPDLCQELLSVNPRDTQIDRIGFLMRRRGAATSPSRLTSDLASYSLLGFSALQDGLVETLSEGNAIRNTLLHRRGEIDSRALLEAPILRSYESPIRLTLEAYNRLWSATSQWANELLNDLIRFDEAQKSQ